MIRHSHQRITVRSAHLRSYLLTGAISALVATGCGGGGGGGGGGSGGSMNPDTATVKYDVKPDLPPVTPDTYTVGPDLATPLPDTAPAGNGGAGGMDGGGSDRGSGGATGVEVGPETGSGGAGLDGGSKDTLSDAPMVDVAVDTAPPFDGGSVDGGNAVCPSATHAWTYQAITAVTNLAWASDGNVVTGISAYVGTEFGGLPWTSGGSADILVSKLDPSTGKAVWLFTAGDVRDQLVNGLAMTSAGLGVIGSFTGTLDIDPVNQAIPAIVNNGSSTVEYLMGLKDSNGSGVWSKKVDLKGGQFAAIAGNPTKDYFIACGAAMNTATTLSAANLGLVGTPGGGKDVIVAAVSAADGSVKWAKIFGGDMDQVCTSAALDDAGNAVIAGSYSGTLDFGAGALTPAPTDAATKLLWVAKFDGATGTLVSAKAFGTTGQINPYALTFDAQGNAIVAGSFNATAVVFGGQTLASLAPTSTTTDAFVVKLDSSLTPLWARRWGGTHAAIRTAAVDSAGKVAVGGFFKMSADVGPGTAVMQANSQTSQESFIVALDGATGQTLCASHYGEVGGLDSSAQALSINRRASGANKDRMVVGGSFRNLINFGGASTPLAVTTSGQASFLVEM